MNPLAGRFRTSSRSRAFRTGALAALAIASASLVASPRVHKCVEAGSVSYQSDPCPTGEKRAPPTARQLNALRLKARQAAASAALQPGGAGATQGAPSLAPPQPAARALSSPERPIEPSTSGLPTTGGFRCDGRTHCSQMTSCAEATYFLRSCPDTKMDGDRNGIPCEKQWCH